MVDLDIPVIFFRKTRRPPFGVGTLFDVEEFFLQKKRNSTVKPTRLRRVSKFAAD